MFIPCCAYIPSVIFSCHAMTQIMNEEKLRRNMVLYALKTIFYFVRELLFFIKFFLVFQVLFFKEFYEFCQMSLKYLRTEAAPGCTFKRDRLEY